MKLIEVKTMKEFAHSYFADPVLRMAVNAVADNCPAADAAVITRCHACQFSDPCKVRNQVWCPKMGRYMKADAFCSEGRPKDGK